MREANCGGGLLSVWYWRAWCRVAAPLPMVDTSGVILVSGLDLPAVYRRLERAGFHPGPYHPNDLTPLSHAIKRFQNFAKLPQTGVLDRGTWDRLQRLYDPGPATGTAGRRPLSPVRLVCCVDRACWRTSPPGESGRRA